MQNKGPLALGDSASDAGLACVSYRPRGVMHAEVDDYRHTLTWHAACKLKQPGAGGTPRDGETVTRLRYGVRKD